MDITKDFLTECEKNFDADRANAVAMNAVTSAGVLKAAENYQARRQTRHAFSIQLEQGSITNQKSSGRCWMFAALNVMRFDIIHKLNLKDFELSQSYPLFYDKLEKSNYFLDNILKV